MTSHRIIFALSLISTLAVTGCSGSPRGPEIGRLPQLTSDDPQAEAELREAQTLAEQGKKSQAMRQYRAFLHKHPDDRLVPVAQLGLGKLLLDRHQDGEALALFSSVAEHPQPAVSEQGRFYAGVANDRLGHHTDAAEALEPMLGRTIAPTETILLLSTLSNAYAADGHYAAAVQTLSKLLDERLPEADLAAARKKMIDLIDHKASPADIRKLLDELDKHSLAFRQTAIRALRDADAARDSARARELVELLHDEEIPLDDELNAIALRSQDSSDANPNAVGAILSLSGRARRVGELALRGLMQAANLPPNGPSRPDAPSVIFRDDAGDPARAVQAVDELANVHHVIAIVGPMDGQIALAAGRRAQELGVPLIALTPAAAISTIGTLVFRYFPTPDAEAKALARSAKSRGASTFAVLYPETPYGQAMLAAFQREAEAAGLRFATARPYAAGATSFGNEAQALAKNRFDVLFVPDSAQELALIAPALAAAGLWSTPAGERAPNNDRGILVLAPSVAFDASLPRLAGRYLQGARFAVPFDPQSQEGPSRAFIERFQRDFGGPPDAFAAFAHDAYLLVRAAVEAGANSRAALAAQLRVQRNGDFVAPSAGFGPDREALNPVDVMELSSTGFVPVRSPSR